MKSNSSPKTADRIWELDFFRGICIIGVVIVHTVYDLRNFTNLSFDTPLIFNIIADYGSLLFIVLSGICVTLGHHPIRRGMIVFGAGLVISVVTWLIFHDASMTVWFGILHFLGICMLLYPWLKRLPDIVLGIISVFSVALGIWFKTFTVSLKFLFPLGLLYSGFASSDFFPLMPYLGVFTLGIIFGRHIYKSKKSIFTKVTGKNIFIRIFSFCGRHSLEIYLIHQPVIYGLISLLLS